MLQHQVPKTIEGQAGRRSQPQKNMTRIRRRVRAKVVAKATGSRSNTPDGRNKSDAPCIFHFNKGGCKKGKDCPYTTARSPREFRRVVGVGAAHHHQSMTLIIAGHGLGVAVRIASVNSSMTLTLHPRAHLLNPKGRQSPRKAMRKPPPHS